MVRLAGLAPPGGPGHDGRMGTVGPGKDSRWARWSPDAVLGVACTGRALSVGSASASVAGRVSAALATELVSRG